MRVGARPSRGIGTLDWLAALLFLVPGHVFAQAPDLSDFGVLAETTAEQAVEYKIGSAAGSDVKGVPFWVYVTAVGASTAQTLTIANAEACILGPNASMRARVVCRVGRASAGGWIATAVGTEWVAYVVVDRDTYLRLKWYAAQDPRVAVFSSNWAGMAAKVRCPSFFPTYVVGTGLSASSVTPCAQSSPPFSFYGVPP